MKIKKPTLEKMKEGQFRNISREFFKEYTKPEDVSAKLYFKKEQNNNKKKRIIKKVEIRPTVSNYFKILNSAGYLDESRPFSVLVKKKNGVKYELPNQHLYLMNLNFLFDFCEEKGIKFSEKEKSELGYFLLPEDIRREIIKQFPEENLIDATLKFYVKNFIMRYTFLLRDIHENPDKYEESRLKAEELNHPTTEFGKEMKKTFDKIGREINLKYSNSKEERYRDFDILTSFVLKSPSPFPVYFTSYISHCSEKKELIESIDKKVLLAIGLFL